jgi:hypothetical protein
VGKPRHRGFMEGHHNAAAHRNLVKSEAMSEAHSAKRLQHFYFRFAILVACRKT